jgi:tripartite-type tricarboxylate transporter receptor subunit TctC
MICPHCNGRNREPRIEGNAMSKLGRRKFLHLAAGAVALPAVSRIARAQSYPARPITLIVPYAPAGLYDVQARVLAEHMRKTLGQSVVIENVGGAGGSIGIGRVARAAPDGYTIGIGADDQFVVNPIIYPLQYDVVKDLEPVTLLTTYAGFIVGKKEIPANNLQELVAWLKSNRTAATFAHNGVGGLLHRCGLTLQRTAGVSWPFVPYRGAALALQDMIGGRIDLMCASTASALAHVRAGLIKGYAVTSATRSAGAPDIPTAQEAGLADMQITGWGAIFAPRGTPRDAFDRLHAALVDALADPEVRQKLTAQGLDVVPREQQTPQVLAALQKADMERWSPILKAANIKAE